MSNSKDMATSIAIDFLQSGATLPLLPAAGSQLLVFSQQPLDQIDIDKFVKLIQIDPGLTAKILQWANSSYFGTMNKIVSLRHAIVHIGLEEAINAAYLLFCRDTLPKFPTLDGRFSNKDYWAHSWACAVANKMLGHPDTGAKSLPGELYIAGLLHGIGKLILAIHRPDDFLQCLNNSRDYSQPLSEAQRDIFGTTDSYIAYEILKTWQLPENICMAVKYFQSPEDADEQFRDIAGLTQFAYYLANTSGVGNMNDEFCFDLKETWLVREGTSSLADETTRKVFVDQIYSALKKKSATINTLGSAGQKQTDDTPPDIQVEITEKETAPAPRKKGFLAWLRTLFSW